MDAVEKATATQLANIEKKTGKTIAELGALVRGSGLTKHGELRDWAKQQFGLGFGDANALVHAAMKAAASVAEADPLDAIYTGPKAGMRAIHEKLVGEIGTLKKGYVSLRRKKQFAMIGPATNTRFEVGLNLKGVAGTGRLEECPPKGMCSHKVKLSGAGEVDGELLGWLKTAFEQAG